MMDDDFLVTVEDWHTLRNLQGQTYCTRGGRAWAKTHNIDFDKFVRQGLPASVFLATGDAIALEFVNAARERNRG